MNKQAGNIATESYMAMKERHQLEINAFPIQWAFNQAQLEEGMRKLGLEPSATSQVVGIGGGGFIRKQDKPALLELFDRFHREQREAMLADVDGTGFAYEMFLTELGNHEFAVTGDLEETLSACGLSEQEVVENPGLGQPLYEEIASAIPVVFRNRTSTQYISLIAFAIWHTSLQPNRIWSKQHGYPNFYNFPQCVEVGR